MRKLPDADGGGYRSWVTLSAANPKTKEITTIPPFNLPSSHLHLSTQETPLEARHFAAAYALFRVSSMKNTHMTLPPQYRDLWKGDFALLKEEDVAAGRAWKYDADPFAADAERKRIHASVEKQKAKTAEKDATATTLSMELPTRRGPKQFNLAWEQAPKVEMGRKIRADIEEHVRRNAVWNLYRATLSEPQRASILNDLSNLGFRRSHVEEAIHECKDREETLEWLLIHVPEDDLPPWSFPEGYTAGISLASGDIVKEGKLKRLAVAGYSTDDCSKALQASGGDESIAAQILQDKLVSVPGQEAFEGSGAGTFEAWDDEMNSLEAIFGERYSSTGPRACSIMGEIQGIPVVAFDFRRSLSYPDHSVPIISIQADLPAYVRLSTTRQAVIFSQSLLGAAMIFNLVEWLETNIPKIVINPGPLREISPSLDRPFTGPGKNLKQSAGRDQRYGNDIDEIQKHRKSKMRSVADGSKLGFSKLEPELRGSYSEQRAAPPRDDSTSMQSQRQSLPAWSKQEEIIHAINAYQCVIISGETGSGKSTQSVQFILDHLIKTYRKANSLNTTEQPIQKVPNIVCTQPRRISAISLANRVSDERQSKVGDEVGYIIRGESRASARTKITFMTTGVLLRRIQSSSDILEGLSDITHIFVDEVHERSLDTDFLLALLRDAMKVRLDLKVVLMSATLDAEIFANYFGGGSMVGRVHISGRLYPVPDVYLDDVVRLIGNTTRGVAGGEDQDDVTDEMSTGQMIRNLGPGISYRLIADLVRYLDEALGRGGNKGGILIFLPGTFEIDRCLSAIRDMPSVCGLPLHASLTPGEQREVFLRPPSGQRKVIAATNVAETSITIEDIVAVIDTGRVKETNYDAKDNIVRLEEVWASKAACKQRSGRAGRVQAGVCYKLFTRNIEENMAARPQPEIRRVPLEQLCLSVKATGLDRDVAEFLRQTLTPPDDQAIDVALALLHRIGALDNSRLTALGRHLSMIPADLRCAKLLVYGSIFGCMDACLTIAAILTVRSPFVSPRDKREEAKMARKSFSDRHGDLLLDMVAYDTWGDQSRALRYRDVNKWCSENFLSHQTLREVSSTRSQLLSSLKDASIVPLSFGRPSDPNNGYLNSHNKDMTLLRALVAGSLNPQIAKIEFPDKKFIASIGGAVEMDPDAKTIKYFNQENGRVFIHPSSALFDAQTYSGSAAYISYFTKMTTSKTFVRDLTRKSWFHPSRIRFVLAM